AELQGTSNKFCGATVDEHIVFCICRQKVILNSDYDKKRLIKHFENSRYKLNNEKKQLGLPGLFLVLPNTKKRKENSWLSPPSSLSLLSFLDKPCYRLYSKQISSYINRTPFTYRGEQQRDWKRDVSK
ncbi:2512_t:CDS:2, partial [Dentiscutata erythropus]